MKSNLAACLVAIVLMQSCSTPVSTTKETLISDHGRSIVDPAVAGFVGDGFNLLSGEQRRTALTVTEARFNIGEQTSTTTYSLVDSSSSMQKALDVDFDFSASGSGDVFGAQMSLGVNISNSIKNSTSLTATSSAMVCKVDFVRGTAFVNEAVFSPSATSLFVTSPSSFRTQYGDGYVFSTKIGERFYYVLEVNASTEQIKESEEFKAALNYKINFIVTGSTDISSSKRQQYENLLSSCTISGKCFATGGFISGILATNHDEFLAAYNSFASFLQGKINQNRNDVFSILSRKFLPYTEFVPQTTDGLTSAFTWRNQWLVLRDEVFFDQQLYGSVPAIASVATQSMNLVQAEITKCTNLDPTARAPGADELQALRAAVAAHAVPKNWTMTEILNRSWAPGDTKIQGDFDGDLRPDLAYLSGTGISVYLGKNPMTAPPVVWYNGFTAQGSAVAGDFDGDRLCDLAFVTSSSVLTMTSSGAGFYSPITTSLAAPVSAYDTRLVAADFNHDGRDEIVGNYWTWPYPNPPVNRMDHFVPVVTGREIRFTRELNWCTNLTATEPTLGQNSSDLRVGDYNGDGAPDVAAWVFNSGTSYGMRVWLNSGGTLVYKGMTWMPERPLGIPAYPDASFQKGTAADFNRDGRTDYIAMFRIANTSETRLVAYLSTGTAFDTSNSSGFWSTFGFPSVYNTNDFYAGDFNGDGLSEFRYYFADSAALRFRTYQWALTY